jgi:hypothetical protein
MCKYTIGDRTYVQKPLVLGQIEQMMEILDGIRVPRSTTPKAVMEALGDRLHLAFAIALVEQGKSPKREMEEIREIAQWLHWEINGETSLRVIEDFFVCNPIASLWEKLKGIASSAGIGIKVIRKVSGKLSSSSREETSQSETPSSGDIAPPNASNSQNTG